MKKVIIPVDGSEPSKRAVQYVIDLVRGGLRVEIELVNVRVPIDSAYLQRFITREALQDWYRDEGESELKTATALLDRAELPYRKQIVTGPVAQTIAHHAKRVGADSIVMGTRGMGSIGNLVLGSVATGVVHETELPVTLIR